MSPDANHPVLVFPYEEIVISSGFMVWHFPVEFEPYLLCSAPVRHSVLADRILIRTCAAQHQVRCLSIGPALLQVYDNSSLDLSDANGGFSADAAAVKKEELLKRRSYYLWPTQQVTAGRAHAQSCPRTTRSHRRCINTPTRFTGSRSGRSCSIDIIQRQAPQRV